MREKSLSEEFFSGSQQLLYGERMIALLCSVPLEAEALLASMNKEGPVDLGSLRFHRGTLSGREVVLCAGGMGKANAAHASTLLITRFSPAALITFGIGGAYPSSGARIGDLALASEEIAGDEGVLTTEGFQGAKFIGIPLVQTGLTQYHNHFPADKHLLDNARNTLPSSLPPGNIHTGKFVTLSTCTGTRSRALELEARYGALCENMEGSAAAQVAMLHDVPWLEVRGISNIVEDRDLKKWDIPRAAAAVQKAVHHILEAWRQ